MSEVWSYASNDVEEIDDIDDHGSLECEGCGSLELWCEDGVWVCAYCGVEV